jgi:ATP phosphoribosyltransferase
MDKKGDKILKVAIPKGSLENDIKELFEEAGLRLGFSSSRDYRPGVSDKELYVKMLRPQEIPSYLLAEYDFDVGISGIDWVKESGVDVDLILDLKVGGVKIVFCVPDDWEFNDLDEILNDFSKKNKTLRISTEYINLSLDYIKNKSNYKSLYGNKDPKVITPWRIWGENDMVKIFLSFGATEAKPPEEVDAIIDNTQTGSTIRANNLKIIDVIDTSTAYLIGNKNSIKDEWKGEKIKDLQVLLKGVIDARNKLHIFMNVREENLDKILRILPALKKPTVAKLAGEGAEGWLAINTIIQKNEFLELIPQLRKYAQGLVVYEPRQVLPFEELQE